MQLPFSPQRRVHELLPKALVRILLKKLSLGKREPIFGDVIEQYPVSRIYPLNGFLVSSVTGIRMVTLYQLTMTGFDLFESASVAKTKYPERFPAGIAALPMNDIDAALAETDRAINDLRLRGVLIYTPINDKPLDSPEFMPLYEKMAKYNLPLLIHPMRNPDYPDYKGESESKYRIYNTFGWPYETSTAMTRIVFSGILEKYPTLKFVTHHCGGMIPYFAERIRQFHDLGEMRWGLKYFQGLTKAPVDYYKMFYADTALYGNAPALMCGNAFFGPDHILFAIDFPLGDMEFGARNYRQTINAIEEMDITDEDRKKIYEGNARKLFRLPI